MTPSLLFRRGPAPSCLFARKPIRREKIQPLGEQSYYIYNTVVKNVSKNGCRRHDTALYRLADRIRAVMVFDVASPVRVYVLRVRVRFIIIGFMELIKKNKKIPPVNNVFGDYINIELFTITTSFLTPKCRSKTIACFKNATGAMVEYGFCFWRRRFCRCLHSGVSSGTIVKRFRQNRSESSVSRARPDGRNGCW